MLWTKQHDNRPPSYVSYGNGGIIEVGQGELKKVSIILADEKGNQSDFIFYLQGDLQNPNIALFNKLNANDEVKPSYLLVWNKANRITFADSSSLSGTPKHTHIAAVIASEEGLEYVCSNVSKRDVSVWCASVDEELTVKSYIIPGLGDAGDLAFGDKLTPRPDVIQNDEEELDD